MLRTRLNEALKQAMLAKNQRAVSTVRLILAALKDRDIAARSRGVTDGIDEAEILSMLQTMIKQRGESIKLYEQGGRLELAEQEREEIGATCIKDMGKVMAELKARYAGQMDFAKVSGTVKQQLSAC